jgi:hypothetical protein
MDRRHFLLRSAQGGGAVVLGSVASGALSGTAIAAGTRSAASSPPSSRDLAFVRFAFGVEFFATDFYARAIAAEKVGRNGDRYLRRALFNEQEHLKTLLAIIQGAGQTPDDFTITFPKKAFDAIGSIAKLGSTLESAMVGFYLGAVDEFESGDLKTTAARIAANEAQHLGVFSELTANRPVGVSFPAPLTAVAADAMLAPYRSSPEPPQPCG